MAVIEKIKGSHLKLMIIKSKEQIERKKDYLDTINVFPVPDGDTGMNMFLTISRIVEELDSAPDPLTIGEAAKRIAKGAFIGAKGNSGVILSQFLMGFCKQLEKNDTLSPQEFAVALNRGAEKAYNAVVNPREGTILTAIREAATRANKVVSNSTADWDDLFVEIYDAATKATLETPDHLPLLKEKGVVDAGAQGFVYMLKAWLDVVGVDQNRLDTITKEINLLEKHVSAKPSDLEEIQFQYCTEYVMAKPKSSPQELSQKLKQYGDSIELIEDTDYIKIHLHTNDPNAVLEKLEKYAPVQLVKKDDMIHQANLRNEKLKSQSPPF